MAGQVDAIVRVASCYAISKINRIALRFVNSCLVFTSKAHEVGTVGAAFTCTCSFMHPGCALCNAGALLGGL